LTSALDGSEWSASRPGRFTPRERVPGTYWIGGWVDPRAVLDAVVERKIFIRTRLFYSSFRASETYLKKSFRIGDHFYTALFSTVLTIFIVRVPWLFLSMLTFLCTAHTSLDQLSLVHVMPLDYKRYHRPNYLPCQPFVSDYDMMCIIYNDGIIQDVNFIDFK
jgi:hypothetical protein